MRQASRPDIRHNTTPARFACSEAGQAFARQRQRLQLQALAMPHTAYTGQDGLAMVFLQPAHPTSSVMHHTQLVRKQINIWQRTMLQIPLLLATRSPALQIGSRGPRKTVASGADVAPRNAALLVQSEAHRRKRRPRSRFFEVPSHLTKQNVLHNIYQLRQTILQSALQNALQNRLQHFTQQFSPQIQAHLHQRIEQIEQQLHPIVSPATRPAPGQAKPILYTQQANYQWQAGMPKQTWAESSLIQYRLAPTGSIINPPIKQKTNQQAGPTTPILQRAVSQTQAVFYHRQAGISAIDAAKNKAEPTANAAQAAASRSVGQPGEQASKVQQNRLTGNTVAPLSGFAPSSPSESGQFSQQEINSVPTAPAAPAAPASLISPNLSLSNFAHWVQLNTYTSLAPLAGMLFSRPARFFMPQSGANNGIWPPVPKLHTPSMRTIPAQLQRAVIRGLQQHWVQASPLRWSSTVWQNALVKTQQPSHSSTKPMLGMGQHDLGLVYSAPFNAHHGMPFVADKPHSRATQPIGMSISQLAMVAAPMHYLHNLTLGALVQRQAAQYTAVTHQQKPYTKGQTARLQTTSAESKDWRVPSKASAARGPEQSATQRPLSLAAPSSGSSQTLPASPWPTVPHALLQLMSPATSSTMSPIFWPRMRQNMPTILTRPSLSTSAFLLPRQATPAALLQRQHGKQLRYMFRTREVDAARPRNLHPAASSASSVSVTHLVWQAAHAAAQFTARQNHPENFQANRQPTALRHYGREFLQASVGELRQGPQRVQQRMQQQWQSQLHKVEQKVQTQLIQEVVQVNQQEVQKLLANSLLAPQVLHSLTEKIGGLLQKRAAVERYRKG